MLVELRVFDGDGDLGGQAGEELHLFFGERVTNAVAVAAARRGLAGRSVRLTLDGGDINIDWRDDGVWMTGPTAHVFTGELTAEFLDSIQ